VSPDWGFWAWYTYNMNGCHIMYIYICIYIYHAPSYEESDEEELHGCLYPDL
jgi:hypothetical protein